MRERRIPEPALALDDIQGNSIIGFRKDHQVFEFLHIDDSAAARRWLRQLLPEISDAAQVLGHNRLFRAARRGRRTAVEALSHAEPVVWTNIAFTAGGLRRLVTDGSVESFLDEAFRAGLAARSPLLGDPTDSAAVGHRSRWRYGGDNVVDAVLIVASDAANACHQHAARLATAATAGGWSSLYREIGAVLPGERHGQEHFGFRDGISQPAIRGRSASGARDTIARRDSGIADSRAVFARAGEPLLWPGQVLLGYPRQDPRDPLKVRQAETLGPLWATNGSYLVIRRLTQDVAGFWQFCRRRAVELGISSERFASLLVGRWPSGAPLVAAAVRDDPRLAADSARVNDFGFHTPTGTLPGDREGLRCPFAAHIRKVNPRDITTEQGGANDTLTRLFLRRGIPFGPAISRDATSAEAARAERGLVFAAYMSSIVDQFEFVQRTWANATDLPETSAGQDPVIGQRNRDGKRQRALRLRHPRTGTATIITIAREFVIPTGGSYFFAPSLTALRTVLSAD